MHRMTWLSFHYIFFANKDEGRRINVRSDVWKNGLHSGLLKERKYLSLEISKNIALENYSRNQSHGWPSIFRS